MAQTSADTAGLEVISVSPGMSDTRTISMRIFRIRSSTSPDFFSVLKRWRTVRQILVKSLTSWPMWQPR